MSTAPTSDRRADTDSPPTTVREVLERLVGDVLAETGVGPTDAFDRAIEIDLAARLRDLATVLTTGEVWRTREIAAYDLKPGDVLAAKDGLLWAVTAVATDDDGKTSPELVRAAEIKTPSFHPRKPVRVLLSATDARALAQLEKQLGAELIERSVA